MVLDVARFVRAFATVITTSLVFGCASDEAARYYAKEKYPAVEADKVVVLSAPPSGPHEVLADFQARGASVQYMRKKAALIGADAVVITVLGGYAALNQEWASDDSYAKSYSRIAATAIKYK